MLGVRCAGFGGGDAPGFDTRGSMRGPQCVPSSPRLDSRASPQRALESVFLEMCEHQRDLVGAAQDDGGALMDGGG